MSLTAQPEWWRPHPRPEAWPEPVPAAEPATSSSALAFRALMAFTFILVLAPQYFLPVLRPFRIATSAR